MSYSKLKTKANDPTTAVFGTDAEGKPFIADLSGGPHWIVAGQTGSGKSVYMNNLLCSIMYHSDPSELEIYAVDPKKVEFGPYAGLPFCPVDPVTNMNDAYGLMAYITWLMDDRYEYLEELNVKNIKEYNDIHDNVEDWIKDLEYRLQNLDKEELDVEKEETIEIREKKLRRQLERHKKNKEIIDNNENHKRMTYIVTVIDEYADLVMTNKEIEDFVIRLAQKARACGITLLIATQRPSAGIISPTVKSNVPGARCA